jgi:hypothetical protein
MHISPEANSYGSLLLDPVLCQRPKSPELEYYIVTPNQNKYLAGPRICSHDPTLALRLVATSENP